MKILAIGDLHCRPQYLKDFLIAKEEILKTIKDVNPNLVVLLGDTLHNHSQVHTDALNAVHDFILELAKVPNLLTYMLIGNHDYRSNSEFCTTNHPFNAFKNYVNVVDYPVLKGINGINIAFMPYVPPGRFKEAINLLPNKPNLIFAHQEFKGADYGIISTHGDDWNEDIPVISGHIHDKQSIGNVLYVGTPYMTTFGESEDKTVLLLDIDNTNLKQISKTELSLNVPKRLTIKKNLSNVMDDLHQTNDYIRLIIEDDASKLLIFKKSNDYKKLQEMGYKVVTQPIEQEINTFNKKETYLSILDQLTKDNKDLSLLLKEIINA